MSHEPLWVSVEDNYHIHYAIAAEQGTDDQLALLVTTHGTGACLLQATDTATLAHHSTPKGFQGAARRQRR